MGALVIETLTGVRSRQVVVVPPHLQGTQLGAWLGRLIGPVDARPSAASAREQLHGLDCFGTPDAELVEVFDQIPELPPGWGAHGPVRRRPAGATAAPQAAPLAAKSAPVSQAPKGQPGAMQRLVARTAAHTQRVRRL